MEMLKLTAHIKTPTVLSSPLHLDGILTAVHPAMHNMDARPTRYDLHNAAVKVAPLPLHSIRSNCDRGYEWVWAASAAEFPDSAQVKNDAIVKRWTAEDTEQFRLVLSTATGALRNRFVKFPIIITDKVYFYCISKNTKELVRLLNRVDSLGGLRKSGYGMVSSWDAEPMQADWRECIVKDGVSRRRLPASFGDSAYTELTVKPPYWHNATRSLAVDVGAAIELSENVVIV